VLEPDTALPRVIRKPAVRACAAGNCGSEGHVARVGPETFDTCRLEHLDGKVEVRLDTSPCRWAASVRVGKEVPPPHCRSGRRSGLTQAGP